MRRFVILSVLVGALVFGGVAASAPSKDDLQEAMTMLRGKDFGVELKFGNYR